MEKHQFEEKISQNIISCSLLVDKSPIIVTLSGGADSVALLLVLNNLGYPIHAVHCNFHLRGQESNRDESFVRELCSQLDINLSVKDFDVESYQRQHHVSTEMACRELRYAWFEDMRQKLSAQAIAVAHHCDDNIETFFLNALRGSGIAGLSGIKSRNGYIVRPLLCVSRADIEKYLSDCNTRFVIDSTNLECDYKRNKIRNQIVPLITSLFPDAETAFTRTINNMSGCYELYQYFVHQLKSQVLSVDNNGISHIDMSQLADIPSGRSTALFEILKDYGFNSFQVDDILSSWNAGSMSGKKFITACHTATFNRNILDISSANCTSDDNEYIINLSENISTPITIQVLHEEISQNTSKIKGLDGKFSIAFDSAVANHKIALRHWRQGDRIQPFGMRGTKLVSDIFSDAKLSDAEKHNVWILTVDDALAWIIGYRASALYPINNTSDSIIRLSYMP